MTKLTAEELDAIKRQANQDLVSGASVGIKKRARKDIGLLDHIDALTAEIADIRRADHSPEAGKMVAEPAGDLVERVTNALLANMTAMRGQSMASFAEQCARAVLALLHPRLEAAEGLLRAVEDWYVGGDTNLSYTAARFNLGEAVEKARAAGLGVRNGQD